MPAPLPTAANSTADLSWSQRQFTAPHQNSTASDITPQAKDENKFAKKNPFADFSTFEQKVEEMKPLAPDANNEKLMEKLTKRLEHHAEPAPLGSPQMMSPQAPTGMDLLQNQAPTVSGLAPTQLAPKQNIYDQQPP